MEVLFLLLPPRVPYISHLRNLPNFLLDLPVYQIWCQSDRICDLYSGNTHTHIHTHRHTHTYTHTHTHTHRHTHTHTQTHTHTHTHTENLSIREIGGEI